MIPFNRFSRSILQNAYLYGYSVTSGSKQQFHNFRGQNCQNSPKICLIGISQPNPRYISVIDEDIRVKFDRQIENGEKYPKSAKFGQKGSYGGHVTHFWNFGNPLYISVMDGNSRDHFAMSPGRVCLFCTVTFTSELLAKRHSLSCHYKCDYTTNAFI